MASMHTLHVHYLLKSTKRVLNTGLQCDFANCTKRCTKPTCVIKPGGTAYPYIIYTL